jgi:hypothetical protein
MREPVVRITRVRHWCRAIACTLSHAPENEPWLSWASGETKSAG